MKVFKFIPPYNPKTKKPNFPSRGKAGVYLIKEEGNIVYVGYSSKDLYKTMYRHFQRWDHPTQEVITYAGDLDKLEFTVRVVYCTPKQAEALEKALIKKHNPRDNAQKYEDTVLTAYDRAALENYGTEIPETPKFSKRELEVLEEDRKYFEERANQSKAIFGDEIGADGIKWTPEKIKPKYGVKDGSKSVLLFTGYSPRAASIKKIETDLKEKGFTVNWSWGSKDSAYMEAERADMLLEIRFSNHTKWIGLWEFREWTDEEKMSHIDMWHQSQWGDDPQINYEIQVNTPFGLKKLKDFIKNLQK